MNSGQVRPPSGRFDVAIIGAGIVGASTARALAAAGGRVLVIDREAEPGRSSRAAVGIGVPSVRLLDDPPMLEFARRGHEVLAEDVRTLAGDGKLAIRPGLLRPLTQAAEAERLAERAAAYPDLLGTWMPVDELASLEPDMARTDLAGAFYEPAAQVIDAPGYVDALGAAALAAGATMALSTRVTGVEVRRDGVSLHMGDRRIEADRVVIAAGAWSGMLPGLPPVPVTPVRGQVLRIAADGGGPRHILSGPLYAAPAPDAATVLIGATEERAGFEPGPSVEGLLILTAYVARRWPRLRTRRIVAQWSGFRAGSPDGRPIIGAAPDTGERLWLATGHGGQGLLTGGLTGRLVARLLDGGSCPEAEPFAPGRPLPAEEPA